MSKSFSIMCTFFSTIVLMSGYAENDPLTPKDIPLTSPSISSEAKPRKSPIVKAAFSPFTGKIKGDRVRLRLQPDLESFIVRELDKEEFLSIVDQEGDFWAVESPAGLKAFVFRSFVIDNVVEGNRVNIRLEPNLEAPIIGHLHAGDKVHGEVCSANKKWLEINPPSDTRFYIAKEFVEFAGTPDFKNEMVRKKDAVVQLLTSATDIAITEMEKPFEEIDFDLVKRNFQNIINNYCEFSEHVAKAKEALNHVHEDYTQKKIAFLENKAGGISTTSPATYTHRQRPTNREGIQSWHRIEDGLFVVWSQVNAGKNMDDYYQEQRLVANSITGVLEFFASNKVNKPGDFVLKHNNLPVAYVYSTKVDLNDYVGKKVTLIGSPRSNNNFAFPAYFVLDVD